MKKIQNPAHGGYVCVCVCLLLHSCVLAWTSHRPFIYVEQIGLPYGADRSPLLLQFGRGSPCWLCGGHGATLILYFGHHATPYLCSRNCIVDDVTPPAGYAKGTVPKESCWPKGSYELREILHDLPVLIEIRIVGC